MWTPPLLFAYTEELRYSQGHSCEEHGNVQKAASILYWYFFFTTRRWNAYIFDLECCHGYRATWMLLCAPHKGSCALCGVQFQAGDGGDQPESPACLSLGTAKPGAGIPGILVPGGGMEIMWSCSFHSYKCLLGNACEISICPKIYLVLSISV